MFYAVHALYKLFQLISFNIISHLQAVHTECVSVSSALTHSKASICLLSSELYAVAVAVSLFHPVYPHNFFTLWNILKNRIRGCRRGL